MADASRMQLGYVKETTWGTTPAGGLKLLRITGESLNPTQGTARSNEIVSSREVAGVVRTAVGSAGDVNVEWSYGMLDDLLEGVLMSTWTANVLKVGTTPVSYTLEKQFTDVGEFMAFKGCRINSMALNLATGSMITGSFGVIGKQPALASATVGTVAATGPTTSDIMNVVDSVQALSEGGVALTGVTALSLNITNNLRTQPQIASLDPFGIGLGTLELSGSLTVHFANRALFEKFINFSTSSLTLKIGGATTANYEFKLGQVKYTGGGVVAGGLNTDVMAEMQFQAFKDAATSTLQITRKP